MSAAVIVAGGSGARMKSATPKQFLLLNMMPVLMHPVIAFHEADSSIRILIALPESFFDDWLALTKRYGLTIPHELIPGGNTRFHSVSNCLQHLDPNGLVAIHDGARPLVSAGLIRRLYAFAEERGNAVPVVPFSESVRELSGLSSQPVDRSRIRIVQTPQVFLTSEIRKAYAQPYRPEFTDDATVLEASGIPVHLADGDQMNFKITFPYDLMRAEAVMNAGNPIK